MTVVGVSGAVLTGGRSTRFGSDKALFEIDGRPMSYRVWDALVAGGCDDVAFIGGDAARFRALEARVVRDPDGVEGPLAGLWAALGSAAHPWTLVAACDLPGITAGTIRTLIGALDTVAPEVRVVVATDGHRRHPTLALYHRDLLEIIIRRAGSEDRSLRGLLAATVVCEVPLPAAMLTNLNRA